MEQIDIRDAIAEDAGAIAALLGELGYPADPALVPSRLDRLNINDAAAFVGVKGHAIAGLATVHLFNVVNEDVPVAMLSALVVSPHARRVGVGRALVERAEDWARMRGATQIVVASGLHRDDAHAFYEAVGYEHTARRYKKALEAPRS